MTPSLTRRQFLKGTGVAGLTLYFSISIGRDGRSALAATAFELNSSLTITPDGRITVHITKAEMGQGVGTALAQIVAEELAADWKDIRLDYPINDPKYGFMITVASLSVFSLFDPLSRAGAAARIMLIDAAAKHWNVDPADCIAERGVVRHPPTGRSISYGELVARVPITKTLSPGELKAIKLKKPSEYKLIGRWIPRLDIPEKVAGRAKFGIDVFLPGMAYAKVAYPPTREGGKHTAVDDTAARQVKGYVKTIVNGDLVAVVAETYEAAVQVRDALRITWDLGPYAKLSTASIFQEYERKAGREPGVAWVKTGDLEAAMAQAVRIHTATYTTDAVDQAPLEPMNCVARYENGVFDLFTGTQYQARAVQDLSRKLGVDPAKIRIHQQYLGGGFGRRVEWDVLLEAALIARETGRPIKFVRSREEDFQRGFPRPATLQLMKAGLAADGTITAWEHTTVTAYGAARFEPAWMDNTGRSWVDTGRDHVYNIPNRLLRAIQAEPGIPVGFYRSVGPGYAVFAVETFLDELAHSTKVDPLQMRLSMLTNQPRLRNVLKLASARSGWGVPVPPNVGRGLACASTSSMPRREGNIVEIAVVVQARVDPASGDVRVEKITCAVDCGIVVNPDGVRAQIEGGLLFGLSCALKESCTVTNGAFDHKNFEDYQLLRMDEVPEIEIHVVDSTEPPTGVGEPPVTVVAPALGNAIFAATGARARKVPFLPERISEALRRTA